MQLQQMASQRRPAHASETILNYFSCQGAIRRIGIIDTNLLYHVNRGITVGRRGEAFLVRTKLHVANFVNENHNHQICIFQLQTLDPGADESFYDSHCDCLPRFMRRH